jgi:hypothetical protein
MYGLIFDSIHNGAMVMDINGNITHFSKDPGPEGPALSSPLKGGQAPCVFETG